MISAGLKPNRPQSIWKTRVRYLSFEVYMVRRIISLALFSYLAVNANVAQSQQQSINTVGSASGPSISSGLPAGVKQGEVWTNLLVDRKVLKPQVVGSVLGKEEKP